MQLSKSIHFLLFTTVILLFALGGGCDSQITQSEEDEEIALIQKPIMYADNNVDKKDGLQSRKERGGSPYFCLVSTLNPEGTKYAYTYRSYVVHIPKGMVKKAKQGGIDDQVVSFTFANRNATVRTEADPLETGGASIRKARCKLPPSRKIQMKVQKQLAKFKKGSWMHQNRNRETTTKGAVVGDETSGLKCTSYWVFRLYDDNGQLVYQEVLGCATWEYTGGGGGDDFGGGGDGDGNDDDPCHPDNPGPTPLECANIPVYTCPGDPVLEPEIAPTPGQGVAGGRFGAARSDGTPHKGLDIKSPIGGPLQSMFSGTVYAAQQSSGDFGNYIIVQSNYEGENIYVLYAHLNSLGVSGGESVSAGSLLGETGDTGNAAGTEPHVHIEVRKQINQYGYNDAPAFDPEDYMSTKFDENGNPIPPENCN